MTSGLPLPSNVDDKPPAGTARAAGISIRKLSAGYRPGELILRELDLDVQPGEVVALVGASGCGKSTLLRSIAKLIQIAAGSIEFHSGTPTRRLGDLAYVFQDATLLPWRSVLENVRLPLELMRRGTSEERHSTADQRQSIADALHSVGLADEEWSKFPRELSGGMRMRTSIARALITDPSVLLLDEPFAALDDLLRSRLNDLILQLREQRPRTIIFVTHNIAEAVFMSHRIAVFGEGRIAKVVDNQLPWPRRPQQRTSLAFAEQYGIVSQALAEVADA